MTVRFALATFAALGLFAAASSVAQADEWEYRVTPYLWIPSFDADLTIGDSDSVESDTSFLEVLDFGFLINGEARRGKWGVIAEYNFLALSEDASTPGGRASAEASLDGNMFGLAGAYRFYEDERSSVDAFGGVRAWWIETKIEFQRAPNPSRSNNWIDPIVGLRGSYAVTDNIALSGLADIGGFGVGSDLQWELLGRATYRFNDLFGVGLGYRHLALDFDDDGLVLDTTITGPFLALDFTW